MSGSGFLSLWHLWGLGLIVLSLSSLYHWRSTITRIPASIPWAGVKDEAFSMPRAWIRELFAGFSTLHEGYLTHNQKGKPFVLLDTAGRPNVILPKEFARWLVNQPEDILNSRKVTDVKFAVAHLIPHIRNELLEGMILALRRDLTRNLGRTQKVSFDTIRAHVDKLMAGLNNDDGDSTYTQLNLVNFISPIIMSVSNRMLVGDELFHNEAFIQQITAFGNIFGFASLVIGQFVPLFFSPVIGFVAGVVVRLYRRRALKYMVPVAQERIDKIRREREDPGREYDAPLDIMQWIILACPDGSAEDIGAIILTLTLAATHTSKNVTIGTFLDLLSSSPELGYYEAIAEEAASVFQTEEDFYKLESLYKLSRIDSAIRESMRYNSPSGRGNMKEVVHPNGVTLPDGQKIPQGAWVGMPTKDISEDERYYPDAHKYDPFRFSRARTEIAIMKSNGKNGDNDYAATATTTAAAPAATTTTTDKVVVNDKNAVDDEYSTEPVIEKVNGTAYRNKLNGSWLPTATEDFGMFGLGRHSCPGRWFASHIMKITVAYIALNYEIQPINDRPSNIVIGDLIVPPQNVMIKVRRRRTSM